MNLDKLNMSKRRILFALFLLAAPLLVLIPSVAQVESDAIVKTTLCEVQQDPFVFDRRLVEITAFVRQSFENFTLFDPTCQNSRNGVWLEYGGKAESGTIYCCGSSPSRRRRQDLKIDGVTTRLAEDANFRAFDKLISQPPGYEIRATLRGRFFAGKEFDTPSGKIVGGYGHFGLFTLFAIEQVIDFDRQIRKGLDYGKYKSLDLFEDYRDYRSLESAEPVLDLQKSVESDGPAWRFDDPRRTAFDALARILKADPTRFTDVRVLQDEPGRKAYFVKAGNDKEYVIIVNRPYYLSFFANDPQKTIWTTYVAYELGERKTR